MWHSTHLTRWERPLLTASNRIPVPFRDLWISTFQPLPFAVMTLALGSLAFVFGRRRMAIAGAVGCFGAVIATEVVFKPLVDRTRRHDVGLYRTHIIRVGGNLFPSAHVTAAAALAMFVWLLLGRRAVLAPILAIVPFIVACSVMHEGLHYPADVIGAALFAPAFVFLVVDIDAHLADVIEPPDGVKQPAMSAAERE